MANTSDDLRILQEFQSEFWLEMQLTAEFQLILNAAKSADCVWLQIVTYVSTQVIKLRFGVKRTNERTEVDIEARVRVPRA